VLINRLIEPVWAYVVGDAIARGELAAQPGWWKISCTTPRRITVDAGREAQQNRADVEMGLKTLSQSFGELGLDFEEEMRVRARNARFLVDLADEFGIPLEMLWKPSGGTETTPAVGETEDPPALSGTRQPG
jgi:capsid protein